MMGNVFQINLPLVRDAFPVDHLIRYPSESLDLLNLSDVSKLFLHSIGVPRKKLLLCKFNQQVQFLEDYQPEDLVLGLSTIRGNMYVLGCDDQNYICINSADTNMVWLLHTSLKIKPKLFGSSIAKLVELFALYVEYGKKVRKMSEYESDVIAINVVKKMETTDPLVFEDGNSIWSCITNQMIDGLL